MVTRCKARPEDDTPSYDVEKSVNLQVNHYDEKSERVTPLERWSSVKIRSKGEWMEMSYMQLPCEYDLGVD